MPIYYATPRAGPRVLRIAHGAGHLFLFFFWFSFPLLLRSFRTRSIIEDLLPIMLIGDPPEAWVYALCILRGRDGERTRDLAGNRVHRYTSSAHLAASFRGDTLGERLIVRRLQ